MPIYYRHTASPTFTGTITGPDGSTWNSSGVSMAAAKQILLDGANIAASGAAPPLSFSDDTDTGIGTTADDVLGLWTVGTRRFALSQFLAHFFTDNASGQLLLGNSATLGMAGDGSTADLVLARDAANELALKNSTSAQTFNHYGSEITAGTRYSRLAIKHATTSVTAAIGATATATNLIPAKANVLGVNTVVTTALGTSTGTTGYAVGDGTDPNRWGDVVGTAAGTDTDQTDATADPTGWFTAANSVVLTAAGGNFDGTGVILVDVAYTMTEAA